MNADVLLGNPWIRSSSQFSGMEPPIPRLRRLGSFGGIKANSRPGHAIHRGVW